MRNHRESLARRVTARVRRLELKARGRISDLLAGGHLSAFRGTGMQFREVREYAPGDDPRHIDWNVTARLGTPFSKLFEEERELTAVFSVDLSASTRCGSRGALVREAAAEFCAVLALSCFGGQEKLAVHLFTDRTELWIPPARGQIAIQRMLRELLAREPQGTATDLALACDEIARRIDRRAVVFLVSDFLGDAAAYEPALRRLGMRHDLNLVEIDPAGLDPLPQVGLISCLDAETGDLFEADSSHPALRASARRSEEARREALSRVARRAGAVLAQASTDGDPLASVRELLRRRSLAPVGGGPR